MEKRVKAIGAMDREPGDRPGDPGYETATGRSLIIINIALIKACSYTYVCKKKTTKNKIEEYSKILR